MSRAGGPPTETRVGQVVNRHLEVITGRIHAPEHDLVAKDQPANEGSRRGPRGGGHRRGCRSRSGRGRAPWNRRSHSYDQGELAAVDVASTDAGQPPWPRGVGTHDIQTIDLGAAQAQGRVFVGRAAFNLSMKLIAWMSCAIVLSSIASVIEPRRLTASA